MKKYFGTLVSIGFGLASVFNVANAAASSVPEPFQGYDENSKYVISYADLTAMLEVVVADVGRSNREMAPRGSGVTGTRMSAKVNRATINEGNRLWYETFVDNEVAVRQLGEIQKGIENATAEVPLKNFNRNEQLAYWLNLYNVTIINEIVKEYPQRDLRKFLFGRNSILEKKLLTVEGVPLSLNDIQFTILKENYDSNPMVIYGLYQGIIGSPNIRRSAYTGANVYDALAENAVVFINANRGTAIRNTKNFRVSSFYERNAEYFPDFQKDLTAHLLEFLEGEEVAALEEASVLRTDINDWTVTDLGGTRREFGGSLAMSGAAMMGAVSGASSSNYGMSASSGNSGAGAQIDSALIKQVQEKSDEDETTNESQEDDQEAQDTDPAQEK